MKKTTARSSRDGALATGSEGERRRKDGGPRTRSELAAACDVLCYRGDRGSPVREIDRKEGTEEKVQRPAGGGQLRQQRTSEGRPWRADARGEGISSRRRKKQGTAARALDGVCPWRRWWSCKEASDAMAVQEEEVLGRLGGGSHGSSRLCSKRKKKEWERPTGKKKCRSAARFKTA